MAVLRLDAMLQIADHRAASGGVDTESIVVHSLHLCTHKHSSHRGQKEWAINRVLCKLDHDGQVQGDRVRGIGKADRIFGLRKSVISPII